MSAEDHQHAFKLTAHVDGCHWWVTTAACECGATLRQTCERDPNGDPYSSVWMMDDDGMPWCERCGELLDGAKPEATSEVMEAAR